MKVAWLCGGYEPGCDGVGDYVRRVTNELRSNGDTEHAIVALRDSHLEETDETGSALRLPATLSLAKTILGASEFLNRWQPDALAWNFVPQMYSQRGIISADVAEAYALLRRGRRLVLFMHELWCGTGRPDTLRNWMTGAVQRPGVLRWLELHRPDRVLTSNAAYAALLKQYGVQASVVPLCGNIRPRGGVERDQWPAALADPGLAAEARAGWLVAGIFGVIHPIWKPHAALAELAAYAENSGKKLVVVWFGRGSASTEDCWRHLIATAVPGIRYVRAGALDEPLASELLQSCDLGLPTVQFNLLGKSGTAAAFLEHGVPLLVASNEWCPRIPGFTRPDYGPAVRPWSPGADLSFVASRSQCVASHTPLVVGRRWLEAAAVDRHLTAADALAFNHAGKD